MGAKTCFISYSDGNPENILKGNPGLNPEESISLARRLFPGEEFSEPEELTMGELMNPPDDEIYIGCYPGLKVIAATEFALDYPSKLPTSFLEMSPHRKVILHVMQSVVDWFAFAVWEEGKLKRSLSLAPDGGIFEDIGEKLSFELPYWSGEHRLAEDGKESDYPFVFHPLDLGEAALLEFYGFQYEGFISPSHLEPDNFDLIRLKRRKPKKPKAWWPFFKK